jgi:hypothetical protein
MAGLGPGTSRPGTRSKPYDLHWADCLAGYVPEYVCMAGAASEDTEDSAWGLARVFVYN